jgi:hypothetical protein
MADFELYTSDDELLTSLSLGTLFAGTTPSARELKIKNVSGSTITSCRIVCSNRVYQEEAGPFAAESQDGEVNPVADDDATGSAITFTAGAGAGQVNLLIDGVGPDVIDEAGATIYSATDLEADGSTLYRVADSDPLQGFAFALNADVTAASTGTLHSSDGGDCTRLVDSAGVEEFGPDGIIATETGQTAGTVLNNGEVEFDLQIDASLAKNASLNPRSFSLRVVGLKGAAETVTEFLGSFLLVRYNSQYLVWRIYLTQPSYAAPHYDVDATESADGAYIEDPDDPGYYILDTRQHYTATGVPDDDGAYIEDPLNPGIYILDPDTHYDVVTTANEAGEYIVDDARPWSVLRDTGGGEGNYDSWKDILAENGVVIA